MKRSITTMLLLILASAVLAAIVVKADGPCTPRKEPAGAS